MKRAAISVRVSTLDQNPETQVHDLRSMAAQRNLEIVNEYVDHGISGTRTRRPGLDELMRDARHGCFDVVLVWACDRLARSVRHFLEVLDELNHLGIEYVSFREHIDTGGPLGRAVVIIIGAVAELERNLIVERVRLGCAGQSWKGATSVDHPVEIDLAALLHDRANGLSLRQLAEAHRISRATASRVLRQQAEAH